jgi:hypothetical protein
MLACSVRSRSSRYRRCRSRTPPGCRALPRSAHRDERCRLSSRSYPGGLLFGTRPSPPWWRLPNRRPGSGRRCSAGRGRHRLADDRADDQRHLPVNPAVTAGSCASATGAAAAACVPLAGASVCRTSPASWPSTVSIRWPCRWITSSLSWDASGNSGPPRKLQLRASSTGAALQAPPRITVFLLTRPRRGQRGKVALTYLPRAACISSPCRV